MKPLNRKFAAFITVASLLFTQWAVAAFPCPVIAKALAQGEQAMPCHGAPGQASGSALCHKHCDQDDRATGDQVVHLPIAFVATYSVALATPVYHEASAPARDIAERAAAPPSVSQLYSRYQI